MSNEIPKDPQSAPNIVQQGPATQPTPESRKQIKPLNARDKNFHFAKNDPRIPLSMVIRKMAANIEAQQKENAQLKAKLQASQTS